MSLFSCGPLLFVQVSVPPSALGGYWFRASLTQSPWMKLHPVSFSLLKMSRPLRIKSNQILFLDHILSCLPDNSKRNFKNRSVVLL